MLKSDDAKALAAIEAGSPVGDLLRRYWMPIAAESEFDERPVRPIRLLGEDLVLYRDKSGTYGLIDRWCPHRRTDLSYGFVEDCGIRCSYHGWQFGETGKCLDQPFEETTHPATGLKDQAQITSYPVETKAGMIWAYLGPDPAPLNPDWAGYYTPGYTVVAFLRIPCNWVQIMENFYDPVHVEWLHDRWSYRLHGRDVPSRRPGHTKFRWLDFEHGVVFQRKLEGAEDWLADRTVVFPNIDAAGGQGWYLTWVVPEDETHSVLAYRLTITSWRSPRGQVMLPPKSVPKQDRIPAYRTSTSLEPGAEPTKDMASYLVSQDVAAWLGPGALVDRTRELLGETDKGIIMLRKRLLKQARVVAEGGDPQGVIRDPEKNRRITLPGARKGYGVRGEGLPGMTGEEDVMFRAFLPYGIPDDIRQEIEEEMAALVKGLKPDWWKR